MTACFLEVQSKKQLLNCVPSYKVASRRAGDVFRRREDTPDEHDILAVALVLEVIPPPAEELIHLEPNRDQDRITCQPQGVPENREGHLA